MVRDAAAPGTAGDDTSASGGAVRGEGGGRRPATAGQEETSLRERLEARVQERDLAAKRKAKASPSSSSVGGNGATRKPGSGGASSSTSSSAGSDQTKSRPTGGSADGKGKVVTSVTQEKSSVQRSSSSQQRAIDTGKKAAVTATMGPPAARKPLGTLGAGNARNGSSGNERAGATKAAVKPRPSTGMLRVGTAKRAADGTTVTGRPALTGHKATTAPGGSGRPAKVGRVSPPSGVGDPGRSKEARAASGGPKRPASAAIASDQQKRVKVDSANGNGVSKTATTGKAKAPSAVRPAKSSAGGAPSFMKPTKTSGARTFGS